MEKFARPWKITGCAPPPPKPSVFCNGSKIVKVLVSQSPGILLEPPECCKISSLETPTWAPFKLKGKFFLIASSCMGNSPKSCSPGPHSSLSFMHKTHILDETLQLARTIITEAKKTRSAHLGTFSLLLFW